MSPFKRRIQDAPSGAATYIAPSTSLTGKMTGKGAYVFCGSMEGDCDIDGPLTLAQGARWRGTLRATDIVVAGQVDGDVIASKRVEIAGTARVTGSIAGHSIAVAEGAVIEGEIRVTSDEPLKTFQEKREPGTPKSSS
jgi:cytoskeletal protein CcmA (bactofilin family)